MPTLIRARLLTFLAEPKGADDHSAYRYEEDGGLLINGGVIQARGSYADVAAHEGQGVSLIHHRPHLVRTGINVAHAHFPHIQVIGSFGAEILDWPNTYTF